MHTAGTAGTSTGFMVILGPRHEPPAIELFITAIAASAPTTSPPIVKEAAPRHPQATGWLTSCIPGQSRMKSNPTHIALIADSTNARLHGRNRLIQSRAQYTKSLREGTGHAA